MEAGEKAHSTAGNALPVGAGAKIFDSFISCKVSDQ